MTRRIERTRGPKKGRAAEPLEPLPLTPRILEGLKCVLKLNPGQYFLPEIKFHSANLIAAAVVIDHDLRPDRQSLGQID